MSPLTEVLALLDAVPFRMDPASLSTWLSGPQAPRLLSCAPETPLSQEQFWGKRVPEQDRARVLDQLAAVAAGGAPAVLEHAMVVPGRPLTTFRTSVRRVQDADGRWSLVGVMLDVTSARAEERSARALESWLVTLGESLPFNFWICDRAGRLVLQNPASLRQQGQRLGQSACQLVSAPSLARALEGVAVREEVEVEGRIYSRVISPVHEDGGTALSGALGVDLDITELKRVERQLRVSLAELGATQEKLVRGRSLAALAEMAATVAHEVRNPLTAMFNVTQLLRRGQPSAGDPAKLLDILFEELNRLDVLVSNLVELVRPMKPELTPQQAVSLLEEALADALNRQPDTQRVQVVRRFEDPRLEIAVDSRLLGAGLINILGNALQAMPEGGELSLEVKAEQRGEACWAAISIKDTGCGMPPEVRTRMFEPFFTTRAKGSGLGLAIVKRVVDEHHGELEVRSEPGRGTEFVMRLPCPPGGGG